MKKPNSIYKRIARRLVSMSFLVWVGGILAGSAVAGLAIFQSGQMADEKVQLDALSQSVQTTKQLIATTEDLSWVNRLSSIVNTLDSAARESSADIVDMSRSDGSVTLLYASRYTLERLVRSQTATEGQAGEGSSKFPKVEFRGAIVDSNGGKLVVSVIADGQPKVWRWVKKKGTWASSDIPQVYGTKEVQVDGSRIRVVLYLKSEPQSVQEYAFDSDPAKALAAYQASSANRAAQETGDIRDKNGKVDPLAKSADAEPASADAGKTPANFGAPVTK
jgi:hypothetical protein